MLLLQLRTSVWSDHWQKCIDKWITSENNSLGFTALFTDSLANSHSFLNDLDKKKVYHLL